MTPSAYAFCAVLLCAEVSALLLKGVKSITGLGVLLGPALDEPGCSLQLLSHALFQNVMNDGHAPGVFQAFDAAAGS